MGMVKGTTKSGIKFQIDDRIKEDTRFLLYHVKVQDPEIDPMEQARALMKIFELVFGSDEGVFKFMDAVANAHDGICGADELMAEWSEMLEAIKAKN